jgi:tetratricopeptide (TPR) repeat protein
MLEVLLRTRRIAPVLLTSLLLAAKAHAEPTDLERARTLFDEAGELERQGQWNAAQERLRAALRIRETPHLRYALGWALENSDRLLEARTEYEVALRLAQRNGGAEEVSRLASARIVEVDHKIPLVQIHVRGALAKDTRVLVDGREVVVHGDVGTVPVDPGTRTVRVERSGGALSEEAVRVTPGVFRVVEVQGDEGAVVDTGTRVADTRDRGAVVPWVLIGGGAALALGGVLLFVSSASDVSARDESMRQWCDATACQGSTATRAETTDAAAYRREAYDAASRGNTKQIVGAIVGGIGIAGIATGTYLLVKKHERGESPRAARTGLRVDAAPLPGGAMAGAALTF